MEERLYACRRWRSAWQGCGPVVLPPRRHWRQVHLSLRTSLCWCTLPSRRRMSTRQHPRHPACRQLLVPLFSSLVSLNGSVLSSLRSASSRQQAGQLETVASRPAFSGSTSCILSAALCWCTLPTRRRMSTRQHPCHPGVPVQTTPFPTVQQFGVS